MPYPRPDPLVIQSFDDAREAAERWLSFYGYAILSTGPYDRDSSIDIHCREVVIRVCSGEEKPDRAVLESVYGAAAERRVLSAVFAVGGFAPDVAEWATSAGVALFEFSPDGEPEACNQHAEFLIEAGSIPYRMRYILVVLREGEIDLTSRWLALGSHRFRVSSRGASQSEIDEIGRKLHVITERLAMVGDAHSQFISVLREAGYDLTYPTPGMLAPAREAWLFPEGGYSEETNI